MPLNELRPHFPGYKDIAPTCKDAEWWWLTYLSAQQNQNSLQSQHSRIVSIDNRFHYWETNTIQKVSIQNTPMGSKTLLCLTGEIAGFLATNTTTHANRLRSFYDLPTEHFLLYGGVLMRPLLTTPAEVTGFDPIKDRYQTNNPDWYLGSLITTIRNLQVPFDEDQFIQNIVDFSEK